MTLSDPRWHNPTVIDHDPIEAIRELRKQSGADIVQYGFGPLPHDIRPRALDNSLPHLSDLVAQVGLP